MRSLRICFLLTILSLTVAAQIPAPDAVLGFTPGDDRKLASWAQVVEYFQKLSSSSDRMNFEEIGKSTMGAPFVYATVSSPENLTNLKKYREINDKLADPRTIKSSDAAAKKLIAQGKTIVLITFGIHSTEVGSTLSSMLIAHRLATANDAETKKILDNTIILLVPSLNPDGVDIVKNWYDKTLGTPYEGTSPPELYHKYTGHDNNRDWYAFTQVETQLTVDKIHNVWRPHIVLDVHQQGTHGARQFLPPYMDPVEPNVPKQIVDGYTELGLWMANDLRKKGFEGLTTGTTYDAWTPARAYSHYHGGVRILSETASARLASPITVKAEELRGARGVNPHKDDANNGPAWKGGEWRLRDITNYMTATAFSLLNHAADNRQQWLTSFYAIGKEAVRPKKETDVQGYLIPPSDRKDFGKTDRSDNFGLQKLDPYSRRDQLIAILKRGGVEIDQSTLYTINGERPPTGTALVEFAQPYGNFAKALLELQSYPNLQDSNGTPISPYDVTAHTLSLLMDVDIIPVKGIIKFERPEVTGIESGSGTGSGSGRGCGCAPSPRFAIYQSSVSNMDEGWTRWITQGTFDYRIFCGRFDSIRDNELRTHIQQRSYSKPAAIIFPDQSANQILNGYAKGSMPDEYTGGVGKEGVENLKKFVEGGGTLVFLNRASNFAIEHFNLPIRDVTQSINRRDFYIPGSILRTELDTTHPIAQNMPAQSIAWFENSPVFEIIAEDPKIKIIARYPSDAKNILLSGWALGQDKIAGKAALVEVTYGKGKIILFGFRPQYRGQSLATFPLLFNAITN